MTGRIARWRGELDRSAAVVVFTVPDKRLREMDVRTGPCVPTGGRKRHLAGVLRQDGGEYPEHTAALYTALTGAPADDALVLLERQGKGSLYRFSDEFVRAMAEANRELIALGDEDQARGDTRDYTTFSRRNKEIADAWLQAGPWPKEVVSVENRLTRMGWAVTAEEKNQSLFGWFGPKVQQYRIVSGTGPYPGKT